MVQGQALDHPVDEKRAVDDAREEGSFFVAMVQWHGVFVPLGQAQCLGRTRFVEALLRQGRGERHEPLSFHEEALVVGEEDLQAVAEIGRRVRGTLKHLGRRALVRRPERSGSFHEPSAVVTHELGADDLIGPEQIAEGHAPDMYQTREGEEQEHREPEEEMDLVNESDAIE